jgi:hypothetical protein
MEKDSLEYFVNKSKDLIKEQSDSFIAIHSKAATITAMLSIFVPLFFSVINEASICIKWVSIFPILSMIGSVVFMLWVLKPRKMITGFNPIKLDKLKNEKTNKILEQEVAANLTTYEKNLETVEKQQFYFKVGLYLAVFSIIVSTILLFINLLIK